MSKTFIKTICLLSICFLFPQYLFAHNGSVAYAHPLSKITVDGDFSDWPRDAFKYMIGAHLSDTKPKDASDFSGFFQLGYRLENRSLYIAFTITDNDFIEDTSENVRWNTQDGLQLSIDARHLLSGSGVASFMYSKKLRNTNNAFYDPFAKNATWDIMEVAIATKGNTRFYEWRITLGNEMAVGKSVGFDFHVFDKDADGSFSYSAWGKGGDSLQRMAAYGHYDRLPSNNDLPESPDMAYSMHTEASIFTRFMLYMLEQKGLKPGTYNTMFQKHSEYNYDPGEEKPKIPAYMGMSLEIRETPFGKSFGHGGNNGDFKCKFEVYKDKKMGYAIFTNSNTSDPLLENFRKFLVEGKDKP